jgi:hypothetical protein
MQLILKFNKKIMEQQSYIPDYTQTVNFKTPPFSSVFPEAALNCKSIPISPLSSTSAKPSIFFTGKPSIKEKDGQRVPSRFSTTVAETFRPIIWSFK